MFGRLILETYVQDRCRDVKFKDEHLTWFEIKKNDAKRIVKRMGWESLADFLNNYTWDDTEILYQIADSCGMIVADWIEREVEDGIRGTDCNELIKKVLEVEELRPVDLAKKIGVSRQYANQIISRSKCGIRCDTLEKIVSALGYEIALVKIIEK